MPNDRRAVIERLVQFVQDELPDKPRVLVLDARHSTGLSTALKEVQARVLDPDAVSVVDDAQRTVAVEQPWLLPGHRRVLLGVDTDDARDLGVDVVREVKRLVAQRVVVAKQTSLPTVGDEVLVQQVTTRWPATAPAVATAMARRLEGRIGLLSDALSLPAVRMRVRADRLCMVPEQVAQLAVEPSDLLEERWALLDKAARRAVLVVNHLGPVRADDLLSVLSSLRLGEQALSRMAELPDWIELRGEIALPAKSVNGLAQVLLSREAPVAMEVMKLLDGVGKAHAPRNLPAARRTGPTPHEHPQQQESSAPQRGRRRKPKLERQSSPSARPKPKPQTSQALSKPKRQPSAPTARQVRSSAAVQRDLARLRGPAAWHSPMAVALRRELVAALRGEGFPRDAAQQQQAFVNERARYFGENSAEVAMDRLDLAEILAELNDRNALGTFGRAIGTLRDAYGPDSPEVKQAKRRRNRALPT